MGLEAVELVLGVEGRFGVSILKAAGVPAERIGMNTRFVDDLGFG